MNPADKVKINKLPTGIPGLDDILGGGLPEFSFNIIAGSPGCGKTTLAHQFIFKNATPQRPALYFTVLGEPALKMLRYQQQYSFFDLSKLKSSIRFINLSQVLAERGLQGILEEITKEVEASNPGIVVVDSFRTVVRKVPESEVQVQMFVQHLGLLLSGWEATTFLIGEYVESEMRDNPVFTVADGLFWLYQIVEGNSVVRKLQVMKLRGQTSVPGLHTFRITDHGLQTFSRTLGLTTARKQIRGGKRLSMGIPALDAMLGGGIPEGDSLLIAGSSGTGKSLLATQFIDAGLREGEPGIVAVFEELANHFDDIIITTKDKALRAKEYLTIHGTIGAPVLFVDDELANISRMKEENPEVSCYLMRRFVNESGSEGIRFAPDFVVKDLVELTKQLGG